MDKQIVFVERAKYTRIVTPLGTLATTPAIAVGTVKIKKELVRVYRRTDALDSIWYDRFDEVARNCQPVPLSEIAQAVKRLAPRMNALLAVLPDEMRTQFSTEQRALYAEMPSMLPADWQAAYDLIHRVLEAVKEQGVTHVHI